MRYARTLALLVIAAWFLVLSGCGQKSNCSGITFGSSGSGAGSTGGVSNPGGSVCGPPSKSGGGTGTDILYYLGSGAVIDAATVTTTTFDNITGYTPVGFPSGSTLGLNFWVVNKQFLYVPLILPGNSATPAAVAGYTINRGSGALTPLANSPFPAGMAEAEGAVADPKGRFLFVSDNATDQIAVFRIDPNSGALTPHPNSPFSAGGGFPIHMVVDGTGNYLYYAHGGLTYAFSIDQTTGALTELSLSPFNLPMTDLVANPTGQYLLGVAGGPGFSTDNNVYVIPIAAGTGNLGLAKAFPTTSGPQALALDPSGKFLFTFAVAINNQSLPIEGFTFDPSAGTVTRMAGSPFSSLPVAALGQFDQAGSVLIGASGINFIVFNINTTTGTPSSTIPSLAAAHDERFVVTN